VNGRTNVLLVVLDSPFLSEFSDRSTVYTQARAPGIHSIASHVSMFTGEHVEAHGAMNHTTQIDPERTIWHELAAESGYATGLFTNNRIVSNASNLSDAFEHVHEPAYPLAERLENAVDGTVLERIYFRWYDVLGRLTDSEAQLPEETNADDRAGSRAGRALRALSERGAGIAERMGLADATPGYKTLFGGAFTDAFLEWESRQDDPWAACINLMDAHSPYEPEDEFDRWADDTHWRIQDEAKPSVWDTLHGYGWDRIEALEPLYDGAIRQTDAVLRSLVSELERRDLLSETLLIVTSDHGEAFGERSRLNPDVRLRGHKWGIHEVLTHVPLVVSYPDRNGGREVDGAVSLTDLPTLMRAAATDDTGTEHLAGEGTVLASTFRLPEEKRSKYGSVENLDEYVGPWRAVYETREGGVRKFARKGDRYLTLDVGRAGQATVVSRDPDGRVAEAYGRLTDSDLVTEETVEIDDELEQQLEDLGYLR